MWSRVAYRVSSSDVSELIRIMLVHGWQFDEAEPDVHRRMRCVWFDRIDDDATLPGPPDFTEDGYEPPPVHELPAPELPSWSAPTPRRPSPNPILGLVTGYLLWEHLSGGDGDG